MVYLWARQIAASTGRRPCISSRRRTWRAKGRVGGISGRLGGDQGTPGTSVHGTCDSRACGKQKTLRLCFVCMCGRAHETGERVNNDVETKDGKRLSSAYKCRVMSGVGRLGGQVRMSTLKSSMETGDEPERASMDGDVDGCGTSSNM